MSDNDTLVLKDIAASVLEIDIRYKEADINEKMLLRNSRDKAFSAYLLARIQLLESAVICTENDIKEMKKIRREIEEAANTQTLINVVFRLISFLIKL
jgi:hypothetical protein